MKIGIISINMYSKGLNFACPLHNYAFQQFLLKHGIESTVIRRNFIRNGRLVMISSRILLILIILGQRNAMTVISWRFVIRDLTAISAVLM